jgi:hypothetical protein
LLIAFPWPLNAEIKKKKAKDASKPTKQEGFGTVLSRGPYLFASAAGSRNSIAKKNEKRWFFDVSCGIHEVITN